MVVRKIKFVQGGVAALFLVLASLTPSRAMPVEVPQDVIFVFDASGSLGAAGFQTELDFMTDIIQSVTGAPAYPLHPARFGAIRFSSAVDTIYNLTNDQTPSLVDAAIQNALYTQGQTHTRDALNAAMAMFDAQSDSGSPLSLVLITDGTPFPTSSQSVCQNGSMKSDLYSRSIQTTIIGVGDNYDPSPIECLVDDPPAQIIEIAEYFGSEINFQQGFILNSMAMPAPGMLIIFGFGIADIAVARRRA